MSTGFPFLTGDTEIGARIASFDWGGTSIGPIEGWPAALRQTVAFMLRSEVPLVLLWGEEGVMIYNDAYSVFAGGRDSRLLGSRVLEGWEEVADFNAHVMRTGLAGGTLKYENHVLVLNRHGVPEQVWLNLDYSPVVDETGVPQGVIAVVVEVTEAHHAKVALEENERRLRFLDELNSASATTGDADEILGIITRMTAAHLGLFNCAYADMDADDDGFTIRGDWHAPGSTSITGHYRLADFGSLAVRELGAGRPLIVNDAVAELAPDEARAFGDIGIAATICMPLVKEGRLRALMAIHHSEPHRWTEYEARLIGEVTERSWAHVERLRAEQELRSREDQLRRSQEAGRVGLFVVDTGTNLVTGTPEFWRIFGLAYHDAIPADRIERLVVREDAHIHSTPGTRSTGRAELDVEYRIRRADDGEERIIARKGEYERDTDGHPLRLVGVVQDVTDRRRVQLALERSEAGFSALAEHIPSQVWTARPDGHIAWFNSRVYAFCGEAPAAMLGIGWTRRLHPDDLPVVAAGWREAIGEGKPYESQFRLQGADGNFRWFLARAVPVRDPSGAVSSWVGTNTDIHEQKVTEVESVRGRERLWTMSQDILLVCDYDGRITDINPSARRLLGWEAEEMIGKRLMDFVHPDDLQATHDEFPILRSGVTTLNFENRYRTKSGDYRLLNWTAVPDGNSIHGVGRDITDHRAVEDALRQSHKMEAVGQLTGGIAHDFNNLLQGITGSLDMIESRMAQGRAADVGRWVTGAKTSAERAAALTHRLLAFSRRQPLDPRPVQANPLIASMEDMLRRTLGESMELELVMAGGLWVTRCDPNQLESAILNLVINARDAMPGGGNLTIETCNAHLDAAYAARHGDVRPGQYVCICVSDSGMGMDKGTMDRAFEPFFTTKPIGQGTGLGLSMIYGFARQSEGYARIYSEPGRGTTVKLYLPRFRGEAAPGSEPEVLLRQPGEGEVVLVVEDEPVVRGLIVDVLEELGYHAIEAADGVRGLDILRTGQKIDLLVTDIGLPGLNGRQVADGGRVVRPGLKVLFMTGYAENAALASGFLEPGMAMITKPFAMDDLANRVRQIIEGD